MISPGIFVQEMLTLYCIAILGWLARKRNILDKNSVGVLTRLLLYITLPALILHSLNIKLSLGFVKDFIWLITMSAYLSVLSALLAAWLRKQSQLPTEQKSVYEGLMIFGNQGYIGYAVSFILLKEQGIIYLTVFNICYLIFIWAYGIHLFTRKKDAANWREILVNPGILATGSGLILLFSPFTWPIFLADALENVGKMTVPLSMILVGALVANVRLKVFFSSLKNRYLWQSSVLRLLLFPMLLLPFTLLPIPFPILLIAFIVSGMPSAPTICLYAEKYGADTLFASLGVLLTTILCIITVPFLHFLFIQAYPFN
ncbi:AEC family transporter [Siminovitchia fortis]|uniref:AEC family transporter n=1 Tax=Siminovitchia fortis TaxID=254758 RepID=A0A443IMD8_9BACI|nr:AEC family transporter [Siminovitchia fortis]RWR06534.1 AEC family transporter [Siminovitchia fortis]WHY80838.1 AEC family transporter [Siminovitchia fortis]